MMAIQKNQVHENSVSWSLTFCSLYAIELSLQKFSYIKSNAYAPSFVETIVKRCMKNKIHEIKNLCFCNSVHERLSKRQEHG